MEAVKSRQKCLGSCGRRRLIKEHRVLAIHALELDCELFSGPQFQRMPVSAVGQDVAATEARDFSLDSPHLPLYLHLLNALHVGAIREKTHSIFQDNARSRTRSESKRRVRKFGSAACTATQWGGSCFYGDETHQQSSAHWEKTTRLRRL